MLNDKLILTNELKNYIRDTRIERNIKLTDLAKKSASTEYSHDVAWYSQIEGERTKSIKRKEIIFLFTMLLNVNEDEAEKHIENFLNPSENPKLDQKKISLFDISDEQNNEDLVIKQYNNCIDRIIEGYKLLFEHVSNKSDALSLVTHILQNMYSKDLGYILSIFSLPWHLLESLPHDHKNKLIKDFIRIIKDNGIDISNSSES